MTLAVQAGKLVGAGLLCSLGCLALGQLAGCQKIVGLEEPPAMPGSSSDCQRYCTAALNNCPGGEDKPRKLFTMRSECEAYCGALEALPKGEDGEDDALQCRLTRIEDIENPDESCNGGSPTGGSKGQCGADACATFCQLYDTTCCKRDPKQIKPGECMKLNDCETKCQALRSTGVYDRDTNAPTSSYDGDSIQCRYLHLINAIYSGDKSHCGHASFNSTLHCFDKPNTTASFTCEEYCSVLGAACSPDGDNAVFDDEAQCRAACDVFHANPDLLGKNRDYAGEDFMRPNQMPPNTLACRRDHSYFALDVPETHCAHAGPVSGPGHCGAANSPCQSFCVYQQAACDPNLDVAACTSACVSGPTKIPTVAGGEREADYPGYMVKNAKDATRTGLLDCRVRHALIALTLDAGADKTRECAMVSGAMPCQAGE